MNSIRVRVLIAATFVTGVMLILAGITLITLLRDGLIRQLDERLLTAALGLTQAFENKNGKLHFEWEGIESGMPLIFRAQDQTSQVIAESRGRVQVPADLPTPSKVTLNTPDVAAARLSDGTPARVVALHFKPHFETDADGDEDADAGEPGVTMAGRDDTITLQVAGSLGEVYGVINLAIWRLCLVTLFATIVTGLILWPVTSFVVWPISHIAARIASMDAGLLNDRIDADNCPAELQPIADRLNEFVSRLQAAFSKEQQTTANIAHELRTPLSGLKATIELAESKSRSTGYYQQTLSDCRRITDELQALVERILLLARLDARRLAITAESVDLSELLLQVWREISSQHPQPGRNANWDLAEPLTVETDRACVRRILRNIFSNATTHADQLQPVFVSARVTSKDFTIQMVNSCSGLVPTDIPRLKDRFFQLDENRARTGRNAGLGLSISDQLARSLGGTLDLELQGEHQFVATLHLPRLRSHATRSANDHIAACPG